MANILTRIAGAAAVETGERTKDVLAQAFPLMTAAPYMRAIQSIPGMGLASAIGQRAGIFGKPDKEKQKEKERKEELEIEKESLVTLDSILKELIKLGDIIKGDTGKAGAESKPSPGKALEKKEDVETLKEGYTFEPPKGKGKGGYRSTKTGRYVKKEEAVAVKKAPVTPPKMGIMARAGQAVTGAGRAIGTGVARVGAMAGGALPWLAAFAAILPFFLPKDIKSVIGDVFEAILQGIGLEQDTIDAIFVPFKILSDVADLIKKILGFVWDGVKSIIGVIGNIIEWFKGRSKVNAAEEVSKATGGKGHGEFVTGGETDSGYGDASVPIPDTTPPPRDTAAAPTAKPSAKETAARIPPPATSPAATPTAPPPAPIPAAAPAASPPPMMPSAALSVDKDVAEFLGKPENATEKLRFDEVSARVVNFKNAIAVANDAIGQETDPEKKKQYEYSLKKVLQPGLRNAERERDSIIEKAKQSGGAMASPAPSPMPAMTGESSSAGAAASGGGGSGGGSDMSGSGRGELAEGTSSTAPAGASVPSSPTVGQDIGEQSKQIEADRMAGPTPEGSTNIIDKGEVVGGTEDVVAPPVPSPIAPRDKLDLDIFFVAAA